MKCPNCDNEIPDGSEFCNFCGNKIEKVEQEELQEENVQNEVQENVQQVPSNEVEVENENVETSQTEESSNTQEASVEQSVPTDTPVENSQSEEDVVITSEPEVTRTVTFVENKMKDKKKKNHSVITILLVVVVLLMVVGGVVLVTSLMKTPKSIYKSLLDEYAKSFASAYNLEYNQVAIENSVELSTDIESFKSFLDGLKLGVNVQQDKAAQKILTKLNIDKGSDSYLKLSAGVDLANKMGYVGEENIYDRTVSAAIPDEYADIIINNLESNNVFVDANAANKVASIVANTINSKLKNEYFSKEDAAVQVEDKTVKVKDNILSIPVNDFKTIVSDILNELASNEEFLAYFTQKDEVKNVLETVNSSVSTIDQELDANVEIHYYTEGLFNSFKGFAVKLVVNADDPTEVKLEAVKATDNLTYATVSVSQSGANIEVASAKITSSNVTDNSATLDIEISVIQLGNVNVKLDYSRVYNQPIDSLDNGNVVALEELTEEDYSEIQENLTNTPLYQLIVGIASSVGGDDDDEGTQTPVISNDGKDTVTVGNKTVHYEIPSNYKQLYAGNSLKSYTKSSLTSSANVEVSAQKHTVAEYINSLDEELDYHRVDENYSDITMSDDEVETIAGREYHKINTSYTYGDGEFAMTIKTQYYITDIGDDYIYCIEIDDDDNIIRTSELEKFLTIESN